MILGSVNAFKQAVVMLTLQGANGQKLTIDAVIDTGFDGWLTVTPDIQAKLQFPFREIRSYELGDGNLVNFGIHEASFDWDGNRRICEALITGGGVLIGMSLLAGYTLFIDNADGGEVRIELR